MAHIIANLPTACRDLPKKCHKPPAGPRPRPKPTVSHPRTPLTGEKNQVPKLARHRNERASARSRKCRNFF